MNPLWCWLLPNYTNVGLVVDLLHPDCSDSELFGSYHSPRFLCCASAVAIYHFLTVYFLSRSSTIIVCSNRRVCDYAILVTEAANKKSNASPTKKCIQTILFVRSFIFNLKR